MRSRGGRVVTARDLPEAVRQAGEAALLLSAAVETWSLAGATTAVAHVYGDRISSQIDGWRAPREVVATNLTPRGRAALQAVTAEVAAAVGTVLGEVLLVHSLAITRLAEVAGCSREQAVADLIALSEGTS